MTPQERDVLVPLLDRLRQTRVADKDADADQLIRQTVQDQPDAPYVLAQTVLMQDYALHAAQDRIHALEQQLAQRQLPEQHASGGFLGGLLSGGLLGGRSAAPAPPPPPGYVQTGSQSGPPYARPSYGSQIASAVQPGAGQPSFLRSAAQTAAGIAGGALLFQGLEGLFGGHGGLGGGLLGGGLLGGSGFLGDTAGDPGLASVDRFVDTAGANDDPPMRDDRVGLQGGDGGHYADQADYTDTSDSDLVGDPGDQDGNAG